VPFPAPANLQYNIQSHQRKARAELKEDDSHEATRTLSLSTWRTLLQFRGFSERSCGFPSVLTTKTHVAELESVAQTLQAPEVSLQPEEGGEPKKHLETVDIPNKEAEERMSTAAAKQAAEIEARVTIEAVEEGQELPNSNGGGTVVALRRDIERYSSRVVISSYALICVGVFVTNRANGAIPPRHAFGCALGMGRRQQACQTSKFEALKARCRPR
jgi:hypothetical protein